MPYILETAQYEGLGQRLVYTLVEWLKENDFSNMLVWVLADNSAKLFYKKLGAGYLGRKKLRFLVSYWKRMCICGEVSIVSIRPVTKGIQTNRKEDIK